MMIIRGVNLFPSQIEELLLKCPQLAPHFLIEVSRPGRLDEVKVMVEPRDGLNPGAVADQARQLETYVKDAVGVSIHAEVLACGGLDRSNGKAIRVRDLRVMATEWR
jgi:phenylacetate-CoA ligase